jgi:hypothetical protein
MQKSRQTSVLCSKGEESKPYTYIIYVPEFWKTKHSQEYIPDRGSALGREQASYSREVATNWYAHARPFLKIKEKGEINKKT